MRDERQVLDQVIESRRVMDLHRESLPVLIG